MFPGLTKVKGQEEGSSHLCRSHTYWTQMTRLIPCMFPLNQCCLLHMYTFTTKEKLVLFFLPFIHFCILNVFIDSRRELTSNFLFVCKNFRYFRSFSSGFHSFYQDCPVFDSIHLRIDSAEEKHPYSMMLPPTVSKFFTVFHVPSL